MSRHAQAKNVPVARGLSTRVRRFSLPWVALAAVCLAGLWSSVGLAATVGPTVTSSSTIQTLAGTGVGGFSGDGGPSATAQVNMPRDTAVGPDGSIFVADTFNNRVRRIAVNGTISTFAGNGTTIFGGDGGPATQASLYLPHDLTVDDAGDVFIADSSHNRVREVTPDGIIHTVVGSGVRGFSGDGGLATAAALKNPKSVAIFGGSLYLADSVNNRIRAVNLTTGIIRTVAGNGVQGYGGDGGPALQASLNVPQRIAFDGSGDLIIADTLNNRIRAVALDGTITTIVGTGVSGFTADGALGIDTMIKVPKGLAIGTDGSLYFSDTGNNRVRRWEPVTGIVTTLVGSGVRGFGGDGGPAGSAQLYNPRGLSIDAAGRLIIADTFNNRVRIVTP